MTSLDGDESSLLRLYDAAVSPDLWPQVLQELANQADAVGCCIAIDNLKETLIAPPMSPELVEPLSDFVQSGWYRRDLRGRRGWPLIKAGRRVLIEHDVSTEEERRCGSYHNEWLRPWDLPWWSAIGFPCGGGLFALALLRNSQQEAFTRAEAAKLSRWRPHLKRAISLAQLWSRRQADSVLATLQRLDRAAFLLNAQGRVSQLNAPAEVLLGRSLELRLGRLRAVHRKDDAALQGFLAAALAPPFPRGTADEEPILIGSEGRRRLIVEAMPTVGLLQDVFAGTRALLLVTDLDRRAVLPEERLRKLFNLTASEAAVAARIAAGSDLRRIAESLEIATGTARNHLKAIFSKTGTHRQSELVALVQRIPLG
ncbi:helix-turn-helix transcriptional regulator [Nitratireductor luteus]|uniref:helix-turn-helix transcriptional regulator n=1 Tax=Nitratireductor luteus TaxID=2976980 RepID=UPI00223FE78A